MFISLFSILLPFCFLFFFVLVCLSFIFLAPTWFMFASLTKSSNGTSKFLYPCSISFQNVYGRFGKKPNKKLIQEYEQLALGNCDALKLSRMLKVTVSRYSATLHLIFQGFFKPQSNFSSSSITLIKKKAVVWNLKGALMLGAMKPLSMKRNLKISAGIKERYRKSEKIMKKVNG